MKNKILKYIKSIFTQFKDLSIPQIIFFVIGLAFWIFDIYISLPVVKYAYYLFTDFSNRLEYLYMVPFLFVTSVLYFVQIFFKKINNSTIVTNLLLNIPYMFINSMFFLAFTLG